MIHTRMEHETKAQDTAEKDTGRVEAFSDGVFSIAMTLLVLELKVPPLATTPSASALWRELASQWPSYFAFITSFFTVLIMWVNHHGIFRLIRRTTSVLLFANGFLLLLVTVVPFPTALVAMYLRTPAGPTACTVYAGLFVLISASYALVLVAARQHKSSLVEHSEAKITKKLRDCYQLGFPAYSLATAVAPFSRWISLGICSALWIFWAVASLELDGRKPFDR